MTDGRLYRSKMEKMLGGVCGGLADYFHTDPALVRLIALLVVVLSGGLGIVVYLAAWLIIPAEPAQAGYGQVVRDEAVEGNPGGGPSPEMAGPQPESRRQRLAGIVLVVLGVLFLLDRLLPSWFSLGRLWPLILILIGAWIIWRGDKRV